LRRPSRGAWCTAAIWWRFSRVTRRCCAPSTRCAPGSPTRAKKPTASRISRSRRSATSFPRWKGLPPQKEDLYQLRDAIGKYYGDKGKYPESLDTFAAEKYLRKLPIDPLTESAATWVVVAPDDPQKGGVYDVKSGAQGKAIDGLSYADW
jgi:hypothetical protein